MLLFLCAEDFFKTDGGGIGMLPFEEEEELAIFIKFSVVSLKVTVGGGLKWFMLVEIGSKWVLGFKKAELLFFAGEDCFG